jgi:tetratricopeptide (TPR) repeat protein
MYKIFIGLFLLHSTLLLPISLFAQKTADLMLQARQLELLRNESGALEKYKQVLLIDKTNVEALAGASYLCSRIGGREKNNQTKKAIFNTAKIFAEQAIKLNPNSAFSNYVLAVAMGRMALISSTKEKVSASREIKKYIDKAALLDPKFPASWHVIGRYNAAMTELNFAEKTAAKLLFGGLPNGDIKTAIASFEKCRSLDPTYIINLYDLALLYKQVGNKIKARELLTIAINAPLRLQDDEEHKASCRKLLKEL